MPTSLLQLFTSVFRPISIREEHETSNGCFYPSSKHRGPSRHSSLAVQVIEARLP